MTRWTGFVCAGGLALVFLSGCASMDLTGFFALQGQATGHDRVVAGSLEAVAQSTQTTLTQMGLAATLNRKGEAIYISSKTAGGAKFTLVLTREKTKDGEQTRVHVEWDGASDEQTSVKLLGQIEAQVRREGAEKMAVAHRRAPPLLLRLVNTTRRW